VYIALSPCLQLYILQVPPFPAEIGRAVIADELGLGGTADLAKIFSRLSPEPVASASVGQVYRGVLKDGREVAVKVQRPQVRVIYARRYIIWTSRTYDYIRIRTHTHVRTHVHARTRCIHTHTHTHAHAHTHTQTHAQYTHTHTHTYTHTQPQYTHTHIHTHTIYIYIYIYIKYTGGCSRTGGRWRSKYSAPR